MRKLKCLFALYFLFLSTSLSQELHIAHWNDFHSANLPYRVYEDGKSHEVGGYAYLAGVIDSLKGIYNDLIVLNDGDDFQGSPISSITKGLSQILILNLILPDVFCIGNHEFDYGANTLLHDLSIAKFDVITTNILYQGERKLGLPYKIIERSGVRIAILGIIYEGLKGSTMPENVKDIEVLNPVNTVNSMVKELSPKVDIIILLSHCGLDDDEEMAEQLNDIDLIIGGHSHTVLEKPEKVNNILICQAGCRGRYVGFMKARVDTTKNIITDYSYDLIEVLTDKIRPNKKVQAIVDSLESEIRDELDKVIGYLEVPWERTRHGESNIGNWITDVIRKKFKVDVAFENSGGIRKDLPPGPIRVRDLWEIAPFENEIVILELKGYQLKKIFEQYPHNMRDILQVSGACVKFDPEKKKLIDVKVGGKRIKNKKTYRIATNNFIVGHMDRFFGLEQKDVKIIHTNKLLRDILIEAIKEEKNIKSRIEGRIIILE